MASTLSAALAGLVTVLEGIDGTGSYNHSVTVAVGPVSASASQKALFVHSVTCPRTLETSLGRYRQYLRCTVEGVVGAAYPSQLLRIQAAMDLLDDVCTAVDASPTLGSTVLHASVTDADITEIDGQVRGCRVLVEAWFHPSAGA